MVCISFQLHRGPTEHPDRTFLISRLSGFTFRWIEKYKGTNVLEQQGDLIFSFYDHTILHLGLPPITQVVLDLVLEFLW